MKQKWEKVRFKKELTHRKHLMEKGYEEDRVPSVLLLNQPEPPLDTDLSPASPTMPPQEQVTEQSPKYPKWIITSDE